MGFIASYIPYGHKKLGMFYRINDEYRYFYLKWVAPIKNQLKQNKTSTYWKGIVNTPGYFGWLGYVFENVCYKHISSIKKALNIEASSLASPWRYMPKKIQQTIAQKMVHKLIYYLINMMLFLFVKSNTQTNPLSSIKFMQTHYNKK